jgi:hypothetical protein
MRSRIFTEHYFIIKNYLHLSEYEELLKVFPEANEYRTESEPVLEYILAKVIIDRGSDALSVLFALELLFYVINDTRKSELVYRQYGFSAKDYVGLTKEYGVANKFAREIDSDLQQQKIDMMIEEIRNISHKHEVLTNERDYIVSTISWRLTQPLRVMRGLIQKPLTIWKSK